VEFRVYQVRGLLHRFSCYVVTGRPSNQSCFCANEEHELEPPRRLAIKKFTLRFLGCVKQNAGWIRRH